MNPPCERLPALSTPPAISASGKYVVIVNSIGETVMLDIPANPGVLYFDGSNIYFAMGDATTPIKLNQIQSGSMADSVLLIASDGTIIKSKPNTSETRYLTNVNGSLVWGTGPEIRQLPDSGSGILIRNPAGSPEYFAGPGLIYVSANGTVTKITNGSNGSVLTGNGASIAPSFKSLASSFVLSGLKGASLDGVVAGSNVDDESITVKASSFSLTNGADDNITVTGVNVTASLVASNGPGGLDIGAETNSKWYYAYVISDSGSSVDLMLSESASGPDLSGTDYTHYGLASIFRNDSASNIIPYLQRGRKFSTSWRVLSQSFDSYVAGYNPVPATTTTWAAMVPPGVSSVSGVVGGNTDTGKRNVVAVASTNTGIGQMIVPSKVIDAGFLGFKYDAGPFYDLAIADPDDPQVYIRTDTNAGERRMVITGYTI